MECNKDEALRSKGIAETKFLQHDFVGARKFAHKARQLFPELEGIAQFLSVLDVHIVAQNKLQGGETNWYSILQVDPMADDGTIRKQYRKLALLLHPDKNKSVGAEAAFKHISEAWTALSDKSKKAAYDMRCHGKMSPHSARVSHQKEPTNAFNNVSKPPPPNPPPFVSQPQRQAQAKAAPSPPPPPPNPRPPPPVVPPMPNAMTFWTSCPSCKMQLEYQRIYLYKNLCCPICYKPFSAKEVVPVSGTVLWPPLREKHSFRMDAHTNGFNPTPFMNDSFPWQPFGNVPFGNVNAGPAVHAMPNDRAQKETSEVLARARKETPEVQVSGKKEIPEVQARVMNKTPEVQGKNPPEQKQKGQKKKSKEELKAEAAAHAKEVFDRLIAKSKGVIEQKLSAEKERKVAVDGMDQLPKSDQGAASRLKSSPGKAVPLESPGSSNLNWQEKENTGSLENQDSTDKSRTMGVGSPALASRKSPRGKRTAATLDNDTQEDPPSVKKVKEDPEILLNGRYVTGDGDNGMAKDRGNSKPPQALGRNAAIEASSRGSLQGSSSLCVNIESVKHAVVMDLNSMPEVDDAITVPDAEFYEFDKDRTENHFSAGQIWAAYDEDDGMPRYYARVNKVLSSQPFKIQIAWLETRSSSDETLAWTDSGFSITCGDFKLGKALISEHINTYSHLMRFEKGQRGGFKIYPRQGDIWALYKDWDSLKIKDRNTGYVMVEVLTDFNDEAGVQVSKLVKIDGFKTLFHRRPGEEHVEWIYSQDLRRFSHQVPAHHLTAEQAPGIMEGCWELDPASTPLDLITGTAGGTAGGIGY